MTDPRVTPICPHLVAAPAGHAARCRLAEFGLYALVADNQRLRAGLRELLGIIGPAIPHDRGNVLSLEEVRLIEAREFCQALIDHHVTPIQ